MSIDPILLELSGKVGELAIRNTAKIIWDKINAIKSEGDSKETIAAMREAINSLLDDKAELVQITQAFKEDLALQKMSEENIDYITQNILPVMKDFLGKASELDENIQSEEINQIISIVEPILSVETLTILQLFGFNFKSAIGEPLTEYVKKLILSKVPLGPKEQYEVQKLSLERECEFYKMINDQEAFARYENFISK